MVLKLKCSVKVNATTKRVKTKIKPKTKTKSTRRDFNELYAHQANAHLNLRQWKKVVKLAKRTGCATLSEFWRLIVDEVL